MHTVISENKSPVAKGPDLEINKGVELMLRNKKKIVKRREPKTFEIKFAKMVSFFKREIHIFFNFSLDIRNQNQQGG